MDYTLKEFKVFESVTFKDKWMPDFLIEWHKAEDHYAEFTVYEVTSWEMDNIPCDYERYISGEIKWDGCSHITFGDENGYIHLCGKHDFDKHCNLLQALWDVCSKRIKSFDSEIAR